MRKYLVAVLAIVLSTIISVPVFASTVKSPVNIFLGDENISKEVNTEGDVYSFGNTVTLRGKADGDVLSVAGTIEVKDIEIGGSIRTISGELKIGANNVRNITSIGRNITVSSNTVAKGVYLMGNNIEFNGTADEFYVAGGNITINGTINGDVKVECNTLTIGKDAKILGKLDVKANSEPTILGNYDKSNMTYEKMDMDVKTNIRGTLVDRLLNLASALLLGLVTILLCKNFFIKGQRKLSRKAWLPMLIGFTTFIVLPFAALFTMITVVGIPVSIISLIIYGVLIYLSPVIGGILVGPFILRNKDILLSAFVGVLVVKLLTFIPYIGVVVLLVTIFLTLGIFMLNIFECINNFKLKS